jgi:Mg2+/Co2+ transporter CorB
MASAMSVVPSGEVEDAGDGSYVIDGSASIRDINKEMDWDLPTDGPKTINGLILEYMEEIPEAGVSIQVSGHPIEIVNVKENKVSLAKVYPSNETSD